MHLKKKLMLSAVLSAVAFSSYGDYRSSDRDTEITLIHMGDLHGHTIPRPNLRSDGDGRMEGGLARMYSEINKIREDADYTLLVNTGDTTQGSGEALYTRGQAMVDIVDMFGVDGFAPGNWEYVYGPERFEQFFGEGSGKYGKGNRWGAMAANLYRTNPDAAAAGIPPTLPRVHTQAEYDAWAQWYLDHGTRVLPPYTTKKVGGVKVGIIGCTTRRGPQVVGSWVVKGIEFTDCALEVQKYAEQLRDPNGENVDLVVLITEIEVGANIQMVRTLLKDKNHVDVILNSDMHEETLQPIQITNSEGSKKTLLIEEGQDGTMIGELKLKFRNGNFSDWKFKPHRIHDGIREDRYVARKVREIRAPFTSNYDSSIPCSESSPYWNMFSGTCLTGSLDEEVGRTEVALHRSNYSDEEMPAVLEGTSHDFIADAIRWWAHSDVATVRGFRYGTHVQPGPITRNDLYHFIPIGARVGKASRIHVGQIRNQVDNSSQAVFSSDPMSALVEKAPKNNNGWAGGWMFAYSGDDFSVKYDPYWFRNAPNPAIPYPGDSRARDLTVRMSCARLPEAERIAPDCTLDTEGKWHGSRVTHITNNVDGKWMPNWSKKFTSAVTTYALQTDAPPAGEKIWNFVSAPAASQDKIPVMSVAGYWYEQSPFKLNNCPNCNPIGLAAGDEDPEAPYILPVNMDESGNPMLDEHGKPKLKYENGEIVRVKTAAEDENRPVADGKPIELVTIIEKYLDYLMTTTGQGANPRQNRVTLWNGAKFPGREVFGFPVMQPLCGTIPRKLDDGSIVTAELNCWDAP